jgi:hypothetical protein
VLDDGLLHAALEGEVKLLQRLARREPRGLDPAVAAVGLTRGDFGREDRSGELLIALLLRPGALGELRQRPRSRGGFELAEQVSQLRAAVHALKAS